MQLKALWQDVLGKGLQDLGFEIMSSTSFFVVGGNSLLIIRLQSRIHQAFNIPISLVDLLGANTLGEMARKIDETASVNLIDWEQETAPPTIPDFLTGIPVSHITSERSGRILVVTGATGFFSKYILPQLSARSDIDTIYCVAVRNPQNLFTSSKIVCHSGNLSAPLLGLSEGDFRVLSSEADVILHMGAVRSFWDNYNMLRLSNVQSTRELVKLASARRVPIHYISSGGVLQGDSELATYPSSAANLVPDIDGSNGYAASKWTSERILERSEVDLGVPSFIYRFLPASTQKPASQELLDEFIRVVDSTNSIPDASGWAGRLDLIPAEYVAQELCQSVLAYETKAFTHYEGRVTVSETELVGHIEKMRGDREGLESVPMLKWFGVIKKAGFGYFLASHEATIAKDGNGEGLALRR
jgi:hybrid polyketide synthase/nonribosomal peptide synthetase ACE1